MEPHVHPELRIAFSFAPGTFDLKKMCPELWQVDDEMACAHVPLDGRWHRLLPGLSETGTLMACAPSSSATAALAVERLSFTPVPDSNDWVCIESGLELCAANLGGVIAAVEQLESGQQTASLQFFDLQGEGCLKLLATNHTDLPSFEGLIQRHATAWHANLFGTSSLSLPATRFSGTGMSAEPDGRTVRSLWDGLRRTLPGASFPGLEGVSRQRALAAAGPGHAWQVRTSSVASLLRVMTLADAPLGFGLRNEAVFLPLAMYPSHWTDCVCGTTFLATAAQFTLRLLMHQGEAWVTRFEMRGEEVLCLELYDKHRRFAAGVGLRPEASHAQREQWTDWLKRHARAAW